MKAVLLGVILLLTDAVRAEVDYAVQGIPAALRSRADAVVRNEEITVDMLAPNKVRYHVKQAITVFNPSGEAKARLVIHYDKSRAIKRIGGRVFDAAGMQTGKFSQRDFSDESAVSRFSLYEDSRVKHFLPAVTTYPYTVEYDYELMFNQNLIIPAWRPDAYRAVAVERSRFTFTCDASDEVRVNAVNYTNNPETTKQGGRKSMTWRVEQLPAQRYEPYSPDPERYQTMVRIAPVDFVYYKQKGRYTDWRELGKWMHDALLADGLTLPAQTVAEVRKLVDGLESDEEKARALYAYLQRKTRYVSVQIGIGGFKPTSASEVDRLGYGDCKGLVNYMRALLLAVDIPSLYCVVHAGSGKRDIQSDFAGMEQGNHVILCVPFATDTAWLECTNQRIPFGFLGSFTDDRVVWASTPDGGTLLRTPRYTETESIQRRTATLTLDTDGTLVGPVETVFHGGQYENHLAIAESSDAEQVKLLKEAYDIDQINFVAIGYGRNEGDGQPEMTEAFEVTVGRYAPRNDGQVFLIPNVFNRRRTLPAVKNRQLPLVINRGYTDEDELTYILPKGYILASEPVIAEIDSPFGYYRFSLKQEGNTLRYTRTFVQNEGAFPAEQYADFRTFINRVNALDSRKVVLATTATR